MRTLTLFFAAVALSFTGTANAQHFGYDAGCGAVGGNNCGRIISTNEAAGLWAGYCHDDCTIDRGAGCGSGCGLFSRLKGGGRLGGGCNTGCGVGAGGFGAGGFGYGGGCGAGTCFGYPSCGCNQGCGGGFAVASAGCGGGGLGGGCGLFSRLKAKMRGLGCGASSCGVATCDPCGSTGRGGRKGCGLFAKLCARKNRGGGNYTVTTSAIDMCGCGNGGQYFNYAVGADYGNVGMQSAVAGSVTGACATCGVSSPFGQPMMSGTPVQTNQFQPAPVQMQPQVGGNVSEQAAGAISEAIQN